MKKAVRSFQPILLICGAVFMLGSLPSRVEAVLPPDFVYNVGSYFLQIFSFLLIFFSSIIATSYRFLHRPIKIVTKSKIRIIIAAVSSVSVLLVLAFGINKLIQSREKQIVDDQLFLPPITEIDPSSIDLSISNQAFSNIIKSSATNYIVLDARENIEYENGYFPDSTHIRFADLRAGAWKTLAKDNKIYVLCWSGLRSKEVAEFLSSKGFTTQFLVDGANGWVDSGGAWINEIDFEPTYPEQRYKLVFTTEETKDLVAQGAVLVDSRESSRYQGRAIANSIHIPTFDTPSDQIEARYAQVPNNAQVIVICDSYINCFDAKITGIELEKRGHVFLGRYNKPWEYEN